MLENQLLTCQNFLQVFLSNVNPEDQLPVKVSSSSICKVEVSGAVTDWILQYLHQWSCPDFLITPLAKIILDEIRRKLNEEKCPFFNEDINAYISLPLMQYVVSKVQDVCKQYNDPEKLLSISLSNCILPTATFATKNKRRQMEDRHVIVNDLAQLFNRQDCQAISYYAIFDGHNGTGAANYSATHLHQFLAESQYFPIFPEQALTDAFKQTDKNLLEKLDSQITRSGTTAVVAVLNHDNRMLHVAWAGDSEALISAKGRVQRLVVPHKADRPDEIERIHKCGGAVLYWQTTYRVNGQLAISRSIGDADHKSCVISVPDIVSIQLEGDEDFIILACDGLWDCVEPEKAAKLVYDHVSSNPDKYEQTSQLLVEYAKDQGSADNITTIVVFLTHPRDIKCCDIDMETATAESFSSNQNGATSYRPINNFDHDVDEDFGPETNVDNIDDLMPTKKSFLDSDTIKTSFAEQLQNDVLDRVVDAESKNGAKEETVKEIFDNGKTALDEESEEEEEDDEGWDYFKANANSKSPNISQQKLESSGDLSSNEMDYTLNPEAREFVPVSPTRGGEDDSPRTQSPDICLYPVKNTEKLLKEEFIASSPMKGQEKNMDDVIVPSLDDFEKEIKKRPSNIMPRFEADEFSSNNVANHDLNNGNALLEEQSFEHDSTHMSTRAVFGDDSTYATNLDDVNEELFSKQDKPDVSAAVVPNGDDFDLPKSNSIIVESADIHEQPQQQQQQNHIDDFLGGSGNGSGSGGEAFENEDYPSIVEKEQSSPIKEPSNTHFGAAADDIFENGSSNVTYSRDSGKYDVDKEVPRFDELLNNGAAGDHSDVFDCLSFNKDPVDEVIQKMSNFDCGSTKEGSLLIGSETSQELVSANFISPTQELFNGTNPFAASKSRVDDEKENAEEKDIAAVENKYETFDAFAKSSDDHVDFQSDVSRDPFQSVFSDATAPSFEKQNVEETITAEKVHDVETGHPVSQPVEPVEAFSSSAPDNDIAAQILDTQEYDVQAHSKTEDTDLLPETPENQPQASGAETPIGSVDMVTPYIHDCTRLGDKHDSVHEPVEKRHYDDLLPEDDDDATKESDKLESELRESTGGKTLEFDLGFHDGSSSSAAPAPSCNRFDDHDDDSGDQYQSLLCNLVPKPNPLPATLAEDKIVEESPSMEAAFEDDIKPLVPPSQSSIVVDSELTSTTDEKPADGGLSTPPPTASSALSADPETHVSIAEAVDKLASQSQPDEQPKPSEGDSSSSAGTVAAAAVIGAAAAATAAAVAAKKADAAKKPYVIRKPDPNKPPAPKPATTTMAKAPSTAAKSTAAPKTAPRTSVGSTAAKKPTSTLSSAAKTATTPTKSAATSRPSSAPAKSTTPTTRTSLSAPKTTSTAAKPAPRPATGAAKPLMSPSRTTRPPVGSLTSPRSATARPITNGDVSSSTATRTTSTTRKPLTATGIVKKITSPTSTAPASAASTRPAVNLATRTSLAPPAKPKSTSITGTSLSAEKKPIAKRPVSATSSLSSSRTTTSANNKDSKDITNKRLSSKPTTTASATKTLPKTESKVNTGLIKTTTPTGAKTVAAANAKKISSTPDTANNNQIDSTKMNGNA